MNTNMNIHSFISSSEDNRSRHHCNYQRSRILLSVWRTESSPK